MIDFGFRITKATDNFLKEMDIRRSIISKCLSFGVNYLDRATGGIYPNDIVTIGARSGVGKSEFATHIAIHNVLNGKRVHFFALEAEECEVERRIKYKLLADKYFTDGSIYQRDAKLSYASWYAGLHDATFEKYEKEVAEEFEKKFSNLHTIYRTNSFGIKEFEQALLSIQHETDLVIVDHLNYFDFDDDNENKALTDIVKRIRDLALLSCKPIVLVTHVRKKDRKDQSILPDIEDIHGTSNVSKIATKIIMLGPGKETSQKFKYSTYFRVAKNRINGSVSRYVARSDFDIRSNSYDQEFQIGHYSPYQEEFQPFTCEAEAPEWITS